MKASFGGILNLFLIVAFIVIISSLLLFNVSYAKAFRVKNKIITTYEQYEGFCGEKCNRIIKNYEDSLGYRINTRMVADSSKGEKCVQELGYCVIRNQAKGINKNEVAYTYTIRTEINVRFPLIQDIIGLGVFKVSGVTKTIYVK